MSEDLVEKETGKGFEAAAIKRRFGLARLTPSHFDGLPANRRTLGIAAREPQLILDPFRHPIRARVHGGVIAPLPIGLVLLNDPRHRCYAFSLPQSKGDDFLSVLKTPT